MNSITAALQLRNSNLWKGLGLGIGLCALTLAIAIPNLMRTRMSAHKTYSYPAEYATVVGGGEAAVLPPWRQTARKSSELQSCTCW